MTCTMDLDYTCMLRLFWTADVAWTWHIRPWLNPLEECMQSIKSFPPMNLKGRDKKQESFDNKFQKEEDYWFLVSNNYISESCVDLDVMCPELADDGNCVLPRSVDRERVRRQCPRSCWVCDAGEWRWQTLLWDETQIWPYPFKILNRYFVWGIYSLWWRVGSILLNAQNCGTRWTVSSIMLENGYHGRKWNYWIHILPN